MAILSEWNLYSLFKSDEDPRIKEYQDEITFKVDAFVSKWKNNQSYLDNSSQLKCALEEYSSLEITGPSEGDGAGTKDSFYFWLRTQQDQNNPKLKAKYQQSNEFAVNLLNRLRFFKIKLGKISDNKQKEFLNSEELKEYSHFLKKTFEEAKYTLSLEEENILSLKSSPAYEQWEKMLSGLLSKETAFVLDEQGNKKETSFSELLSLMSNQNKKIRDSAALAFNDILEKHSDIAEAEINAILSNKKVDDQLRKAERPDTLRLVHDEMPKEVIDALIETVSQGFEFSKRYYSLKARLLGLQKLQYHERNVPYGENYKKYTYEEAFNLVNKTFNSLDKEFADIFIELTRKGQVDVFPRKGKRQGAFCTDSLLYQPTYILLNYTQELNDVLTIAHEFGHAINSELMKKKCNALSCGMLTSTAEVASTFMEDFVLQEILKTANDELRLSLMMSKLNDDISSIMRQIACYKFEQELHSEFRKRGYLSKEEIGNIFIKNMSAYMGESVEQTKGCENWWIYWSHIRSFFYVYSYASGLLISKYMQGRVKQDKTYILKVKDFLSAGISKSPKEVFSDLGIDISKEDFWKQGLNEIEFLLIETEDLAKKLRKI